MEEDINLSSEIYPWALGKNEVKNELSILLELKSLLWQAMDHRAAVSRHCCTQVRLTACNFRNNLCHFSVLPNYRYLIRATK